MKNRILILVFFYCLAGLNHGQDRRVDSLIRELKSAKADTARVNTLNMLADAMRNYNPDTLICYARQAEELAIRLNYKMGIITAQLTMSTGNINLGKFDEALKNCNSALTLSDQLLLTTPDTEETGGRSNILNQKARILKNMGVIYGSRGNYIEATKYTLMSLKICEKTGNKPGIASCFNSIGLINYYQGNYPESLKNYYAALKINKETGDKKGIALNYGNIGNIYGSQGNYPEALKNFLASLQINEEIGDKQGIARCNGNIGLIYFFQGNYSEALEHQFAALKMNEEIGDKQGIALNYGNIGNNYGAQGNFSEALKNELAALKINEETGDKHAIALNYGNIGNIYQAQSNYPEALKSQFNALKICEEIGDKPGIALSYYNIGEIYKKQKDYNAAFQYLNKSLTLAKENGSLNSMKESYGALAALDSAQGDFRNSLKNYKMFIAARDSLENQVVTKKITQIQMQFEFDKKESLVKAEQENKDAVALKELQKQKLLRNFSAGIIVSVVVLFFFMYRAYRSRQKLRLHGIRNKIAGDLHDDIGSTLNSISIYSEVAKKKDGNQDEALEMIGDASRKVIDAMSDIVWTINSENDSFDKIIFRMKSLAYNLFRAKNIEFTFHADETLNEKKLSLEHRRNFYLIFKEALNNLVKYANATRAAITLTNETYYIKLRIQDNGAGFDTSQENAGNGLKNMKRRADEMNAEFKLESKPGNGTQIELILKA